MIEWILLFIIDLVDDDDIINDLLTKMKKLMNILLQELKIIFKIILMSSNKLMNSHLKTE